MSRWMILLLCIAVVTSFGCYSTWRGLKRTGDGLAQTGEGMIDDAKHMPERLQQTDNWMRDNWW